MPTKKRGKLAFGVGILKLNLLIFLDIINGTQIALSADNIKKENRGEGKCYLNCCL
jgi:hypothetical protein